MSERNQTLIPTVPQASRRGLLICLMAAAAVPAAPAIAKAVAVPGAVGRAEAVVVDAPTPSPDAKLLQLFDEYMSTAEEHRRVYGLYQRGRAKHQAKHPMPEVMLVRPEDAELGLPDRPGDGSSYEWCIQELKRAEWPVYEEVDAPDGTRFWGAAGGTVFHYEPPSAAARARADEIIEAHNEWHDRYWYEPREARSLERQADRLSKRKDKLRAKIDRTRAHTIAGLAAKAQVAAIEGEHDTQFADTTLWSIARDMRAMSRRARA
jgi:hypothetical protein